MSEYPLSPAWFEDIDRARRAWKATAILRSERGMAHVIADAGTGSRYSVVATALSGPGAAAEGGDALVAVLSPWRTCYVMQSVGYLDWAYIAEKLIPASMQSARVPLVNGGDLAGLCLTVGAALGREISLPQQLKEVD